MAATTIIGIDRATQPEETGLALAAWDGRRIVLREIACGSRQDLLASIVARECPRACALPVHRWKPMEVVSP